MSETKYIEDPEDIRLNENRELQQILGNPPGWLLHWGNTFIGVGLLVFLILGWFVKYPDVVPTQVFLTTPNPPIRVFAETEGKLIEFHAEDNQEVFIGDTLAILDNPASLEDVGLLNDFLEDAQESINNTDIVDIEIPRNLKLGMLQGDYANFSKKFDSHVFFLKNHKTFSKVKNLEKQIARLEDIGLSLEQQERTMKKEVALAESKLERNKKLNATKDLSDVRLEESRIEVLGRQRQMEAIKDVMLNNNLSVERTRMQILEMKENYRSGRSSGMLSIQEDIERMRSALDNWRKTFLIQAPIAGRISLTKFISDNQYIKRNEELLTIVPDTTSRIIAKGILPPMGSGKVLENMQTNIRLSGYPYQEFGSLKCKVERISLVPKGEGFAVEFSVPRPMKTTYDKIIPFQQEMRGTANIITEDRRILERVFDRILSIIFND